MSTPCDTCAVSAQCQPYGEEYTAADGVFIKEMRIPKARTIIPQHSHEFDHTSFVVKGSVLVVTDLGTDAQEDRYVGAPRPIFIPAGVKHTFQSLEDDTLVLCIHNVSRSGHVEIREEHQLSGAP